ncbi:MAG: hypothetical protein GF331_10435 [Chitinivibrionales bacterium]|nr:hypothetical protein [Chitinivibrionales bacterium]
MTSDTIMTNRAPVLTLWAAVVAERLGFERDEALTLGKAVAGLNAQAKGRSLGIYKPGKDSEKPSKKAGLGEELWVEVCGRAVPAQNTADGVRAVVKDKAIRPESVQKYLEGKFGDDLDRVIQAMTTLAHSLSPEDLADRAYHLYEQFRPKIQSGQRGWGQKGALDLSMIRSMAE